jgi:hypothetical protein
VRWLFWRTCWVLLALGVGITMWFADARDFERRLLAANIKKKGLPWSEEMFKDASLKQLYLYDRYGLRAYSAMEDNPEGAELAYGLFGDQLMFDRVVRKLGDHYVIAIIASCYHSDIVCVVREDADKLFARLKLYFSSAALSTSTNGNGRHDKEKIVRASCALINLYLEGARFMGDFVSLPDGTVVYDPLPEDAVKKYFLRNRILAEKTQLPRSILEPVSIGEPARTMELLRLGGATGQAVDLGATPGEISRWNLFADLARIFQVIPEIAPAFFTERRFKGTLKGFGNLLWADPAILPAAIAKASGASGVTLLLLQFIGWTALPSLVLLSPFIVY